MAKFKAVLYSAAVVMFIQTVLFAGTIGVEVTPNTWDAGTHGAGTFSTTGGHFTVANPGTDNAKMKIRATNTTPTNWVLSTVPGKDTFALQWQESGSTWNPILDTENTMFNSLTGGTQKSFDLSFLSPTSLTDPSLTAPQTTVVTLSANPAILGIWEVQTIDSTGDVGRQNALVIDLNNNPQMSYYDNTNSTLKYAKWTGSDWDIQTVDSVGGYSSIGIDSNNNPHISYYGGNGDLKYAKWTGSSWDIQTVDSVGDVGYYTSITLDTNSNPHISYYDATNLDLKYAKWTGSSWNIQTVDSIGDVGWHTSIALDTNNNPHISYYDNTNFGLKYAKWTGSGWDITTIQKKYAGMYSCINIDTNNNPHITYYAWLNPSKYIRYAKWTGSDWDIQTIGDGIMPNSSLDSNNKICIAYKDYPSNNLKFVKWTGSSWAAEIVDSINIGGNQKDISVMFDNNNMPRIIYFDLLNSNLKFAIWK